MLTFFEILIAYLIGSICSAVLVSQACGLPDPRTEGSHNPGATNVLRLSGKKYAVIVLLADMLKGLLPVLICHLLGASPTLLGFVALAAVFGHMFPVFFKFHGGKGVATALGAMFGLKFLLGVAVLATWLIVARWTRYSSLASIIATVAAPFYSLTAFQGMQAFIPLLFIALFIVYKHHQNITRLMDGVESKIDLKTQRSDKK